LNVHFCDRQHDGTRGSPTALERLRIERLGCPGGLRDIDRDRAGHGVQPLGLVAVGVAAPFRAAFIQTGAEEALALQAHGEIEQGGENLGHAVRPLGNELFHERGDDRILGVRHPGFLPGRRNTWIAIQPIRSARCADGHPDPQISNLQTSRYTARAASACNGFSRSPALPVNHHAVISTLATSRPWLL